jgi:hypothetical protein
LDERLGAFWNEFRVNGSTHILALCVFNDGMVAHNEALKPSLPAWYGSAICMACILQGISRGGSEMVFWRLQGMALHSLFVISSNAALE